MQLRRELAACFVVAVIVTAIAAIIAVLDPMGLDEASDRHSAGVVGRMTAPFYGGEPGAPPHRPTVVLVSDATLQEMATPWPPPRGFYSDLVRTLAAERPSAIFLDYMLVSEFGEPSERQAFIQTVGEVTRVADWPKGADCRSTPLHKLKCIVQAGGVPVILGKQFPPDQCGPVTGKTMSMDMIAQDGVALLAPLGWPDLPDAYRPVLTRQDYAAAMNDAYGDKRDPALIKQAAALMESCKALRTIEVPGDATRPGFAWHGGAEYDLSPAMAAYAVDCLRAPARPNDGETLCGALRALPTEGPAFRETLDRLGLPAEKTSVIWGSRPDPKKLALDDKIYAVSKEEKDCDRETRSPLRLLSVGFVQLSSAIGEHEAAAKVACPYAPTFDYAVLRDELTGPRAGEVRGYLTGRTVMVGAAQSGNNDWISNVVHGRQPGVQFHAMAYDNLVRLGPNLQRPPPDVFEDGPLSDLNLDWGEVLEFACAFSIAFLVEHTRRRVEAEGVRRRDVLRKIVGLFLMSCVVLTTAVIFTQTRHWEPVNIVGLFGFTIMDGVISFWSIEGFSWSAILCRDAVVVAWRNGVRKARALLRRRPASPPPPRTTENEASSS